MKMVSSSKVQVKLNLFENFAFKNMWKKDKGWSLQKVILKRALKFETLGRFIENKKNVYTVYSFDAFKFDDSCLHTKAKNIYFF